MLQCHNKTFTNDNKDRITANRGIEPLLTGLLLPPFIMTTAELFHLETKKPTTTLENKTQNPALLYYT